MLTRILLPVFLLAGFAGLLLHAARETLSPPQPVTVVPVLISQTSLDQPADTPLFRAAGWIEPRPSAQLVTAQAEGVVDKVLVVEGDPVQAGQLVARLVAADARLALEGAEAEVQLRESEVHSSEAVLVAATARKDHPVHLQAELAEAESALAKVEGELDSLASQLKGAAARLSSARRDWEYRQRASDVVPMASTVRSKAEFEEASATLEDLQGRQKRLPAQIGALKSKREALRKKLEGKVDEVRQLAEAEAGLRAAKARLRQARVAQDTARLRLERMEIRATASGKVLALVARPGMRLTGLNPGSLHDSSTVLTLYDPANLQVRVDVRLEDVAKIQSGQKARIESAAVSGRTLLGEVLLATSQADIQKNTLSVKVAVIDPPATLRPEMLCQVTFLAAPKPAEPGGGVPYRLLVPRTLIEESAVWLADRLSGTARRRTVEVGQSMGELVEIVKGLSPSDKLIVGGRSGLREGMRIRVEGEDETLGIDITSKSRGQ